MTIITFLDSGTFPKNFNFTHPSFKHEWQIYEETKPEQTVERLKDTEIVITNKVKMPKEVLESCPNLKLIAIAATGYDHIDIDEATKNGIMVCNIRGYAVNTVPEHAMAMILCLARSLQSYGHDVENGRWQTEKQFCFFGHPIEDLHDKTLGLIGRGILGQGLARLASGFGMGITYAGRRGDKNPHRPYIPFDDFLKTADIISIHCPLSDDTRDLITSTEFAKMERKPILINTARGGIVNEADAVKAINEGQIRALGFDCLSSEPPSPNNPLLSIASKPNVLITPHVAWASTDAIQKLWDQLIYNIEQFHKGNPQNRI